jgi:putative colanic acid biosynthesis UDP-glucose lipid carrier transferase
MGRRILAAVAQVALAPPLSGGRRELNLHLPQRIVLDLLALADVALVAVAAVLAKFLYITLVLGSEQALEPYLLAGVAGGVIMYYVARGYGLHERGVFLNWRARWGDLLFCVGTAFLALIVIAFLLKMSETYSRGWLVTWFALSVALVTFWRIASARVLAWLDAMGSAVRRIVVVAADSCGEGVAEQLRKMPGIGVVGVFATTGTADERSVIEKVISIGERNEIDEVIVAFSRPDARVGMFVDQLSVLPVHVWLHFAELALPIRSTQRLGAINLLEARSKPIGEWGRVCKVVFDYAVGALCLLVFGPLMLLIALAIRIDSPGPAIFRQQRNGYNNRIIDVYKFRTMYVVEKNDEILQASKNDARVTRLGKFLRRTSLDELPQLLNVLKGEMSLVGPRPHALAHNHYYRKHVQSYAQRHLVRPGITGLSQINGLRGSTEVPEMMHRRVQTDLYYIENWSFGMDMKILALTPVKGFIHRNAY